MLDRPNNTRRDLLQRYHNRLTREEIEKLIGGDEINGFAADHETAKRIAERAPEMFGQAGGPLGWPNAVAKLAKLIEAGFDDVRDKSRAEIERLTRENDSLLVHLGKAAVRAEGTEDQCARAERRAEAAESALAKARAALEVARKFVAGTDDGDREYILAVIDGVSSLSKGAQSETPLSEAVKEIGALFDPAEVERVNEAIAAQSETAPPSLRDAAMEEAAKIADALASNPPPNADRHQDWQVGFQDAAMEITAAIRNLKSPPPGD